MQTINIPEGGGTPAIVLDFDNASFSFKGESYPEDVNAFYGGILESIKEYLATLSGQTLKVTMHLVYFNSSSTKVFHNMFAMLENAINTNDIGVGVDWIYHEEDDMSLEFAQGFMEDFESIRFNLCPHS